MLSLKNMEEIQYLYGGNGEEQSKASDSRSKLRSKIT